MKRVFVIVALTAAAACINLFAQPPAKDNWIGIWHAHVNGRPTDTLTLASDPGKLGGTIVLDMVSEDSGSPRVIASDPHLLMNPHLNGETLSFQVRMKMRDGKPALRNFTATLLSQDKADVHCLNCGADAPVVEFTRDR